MILSEVKDHHELIEPANGSFERARPHRVIENLLELNQPLFNANPNSSNLFPINSFTGTLTVLKPLDPEAMKQHLLTVMKRRHSFLKCIVHCKMQDTSKELNRLSAMLSQLLLPANEHKYLSVANLILCLMNRDLDLSPLAEKMIKLLALPYPPFKRIVCSYLIRYADNISNVNVLATNCFLKDFEDPNPFVRRLVIKTVCHIPCLHELAFQLIPMAFCDNSPYVRCAAASSCSLIINDDNLPSKQSIIDKLYDMIRDPDSSVVSSSLSVLDVILQSEGGIVINTRLARYLISRIGEFQEWHFPIVCGVLKKYIPKSEEELFSILNAVDEKLTESNPLVFISASDLALFYISALNENFSSDIIEQILPRIQFLFCHSNEELLCEALDLLKKYINDHSRQFSQFYKLLFCRFSDPIFIKIKKLQIITDLGNTSNFLEIAEELLMYSSYNIKEVAIQSIKSFIKFVLMHPVPNSITESFVYLMDIKHNNLNEEVLIALCSSKLKEREDFRHIFLPSISKISSSVSSTEGKLAILKLIATYGKFIERSPYVIEDLLNDLDNIQNEKVMLMIIIAAVKLFLVRPAEMQLLLGQILQIAESSDNLLLKKQSAIYHHLLTNTSASNKILLTQ